MPVAAETGEGRGWYPGRLHTCVRKTWKRLIVRVTVDFLDELLELVGWTQDNDEETEKDLSWLWS